MSSVLAKTKADATPTVLTERGERAGAVAEVPAHLRDSHYSGASELGHGTDYVSPHDDVVAAREQRYLPDELADRGWYRRRRSHDETREAD